MVLSRNSKAFGGTDEPELSGGLFGGVRQAVVGSRNMSGKTNRIGNFVTRPQRTCVEQPVGDVQLPLGACHGVEGQQSHDEFQRMLKGRSGGARVASVQQRYR